MAESRKYEPEQERKAAQPAPAVAKDLAPASEASDPDVHRLLAERDSHVQNAEPDLDREPARKAAREAIEAIDKQLADLGYTAK